MYILEDLPPAPVQITDYAKCEVLDIILYLL